MNPTLNKKDFEDLSTNLKDLAYGYIEKYSPSKQQLKVYLLKKYLTKIKGTKSKKEVSELIEQILTNLEANNLVNDEQQLIFLINGTPMFTLYELFFYIIDQNLKHYSAARGGAKKGLRWVVLVIVLRNL